MITSSLSSGRNACPGAEILGRLCYARSYGYRRVAMPAQGQKSWDGMTGPEFARANIWSQCLPRGRNPGTEARGPWSPGQHVAMPAQGQKFWDARKADSMQRFRPSSQCLPRGRNPGTAWNCACRPVPGPSQCLPRGRNPGTAQTNLDARADTNKSQCLPRGRNPGTRHGGQPA